MKQQVGRMMQTKMPQVMLEMVIMIKEKEYIQT
jgi:hypothetical protein